MLIRGFLLGLFCALSASAQIFVPSRGTTGAVTNIAVNGEVGTVSGNVAYAAVDIPEYDPVGDLISAGSISGRSSALNDATATLASSVTSQWWGVSASSNGLVVAALAWVHHTGFGWVYVGTNGPDSLVKNTAYDWSYNHDVKVTPDGERIYVARDIGLYLSTNQGASWAQLVSDITVGGAVSASDDGQCVLYAKAGTVYMTTNGSASWSQTNLAYSSGPVAVSGDGNTLMYMETRDGVQEQADARISTNRGATWSFKTNGIYGAVHAAASRNGDYIYISSQGQSANGAGQVKQLKRSDNYDSTYDVSPFADRQYRGVDCSPDGSGIIALSTSYNMSGGDTGRVGAVYVSTNFGSAWGMTTNNIDVWTVTSDPIWNNWCTWVDTMQGGYAVKDPVTVGQNYASIYRVEIGQSVTNDLTLLGGVNVLGTLAVNGNAVLTNESDTLATVAARGNSWTGGVTIGTITHTGQAIKMSGLSNHGVESEAYSVGSSQSSSTWFGPYALYQSTGLFNIAFGLSALHQSPGNENSAVSFHALKSSGGSYNSAMGASALKESPGSYNSSFGRGGLFQAPGSYNTSVGASAGRQSSGVSNVFVGAYAAVGTPVTNAICLGAGSSPNGDNSMVLGNPQTTKTTIYGDTTNTGSITAGGGFYGNGVGVTNVPPENVNNLSWYAAPACRQLTFTNTSALSWTNTWSPTSKVSRVTLTSTGTCTFVWNWPSGQDASMRFALDMTGMPAIVFPAGAIYLTNGLYGSTAPSLGVSNYVNVIHDPVTYQVMAWTNTLGTWGTP